MAITPEDLLAYGGALCAGPSEVVHRSSVSRSYYAAYHGIEAWERTLVPGSNEGANGGYHQKLINRLRRPARENGRPIMEKSVALAAHLEALKILRHNADYQLRLAIDQTVAENAHEMAKRLISKI